MKLLAEDKALLDHSRKQMENLGLEIKTIDGFITQYLANKYGVKTNEELQALLNGTELTSSPSLVKDETNVDQAKE